MALTKYKSIYKENNNPLRIKYNKPYPVVLPGAEITYVTRRELDKWANKTFKNELKNLKDGDIVWLKDKQSKYRGYYKVSNGKFENIGVSPRELEDYKKNNDVLSLYEK